MAQDRISELPDALIQHILSFLPSTRQAIRTGILSKRWHKQWIHVPVLIFRSKATVDYDFLDFVDKTLALHDCSKINTFYLHYNRQLNYRRRGGYYKNDASFDEKIRFATAQPVENLTLNCDSFRDCNLPAFVFDTTSLVKLRTRDCSYFPTAKVNWVSLKALSLVECRVCEQSMQYILSGSPLVETLEVNHCYPFLRDEYMFEKLVITSKSLQKLVLRRLRIKNLEVSCPNLKELCVNNFSAGDPKLLDRAIEYLLSNSLLLESLKLRKCYRLHRLVIASKSLKRLALRDISCSNGFEISCPNLDKLRLSGSMNTTDVKFQDVPSSLCASLSFCIKGPARETANSLSKDILQQFQHIKKLRVGNIMGQLLI